MVSGLDERALLQAFRKDDRLGDLLEQTRIYAGQLKNGDGPPDPIRFRSHCADVCRLTWDQRLVHEKAFIDAGAMTKDEFREMVRDLNPNREVLPWVLPSVPPNGGSGGASHPAVPARVLKDRLESAEALLLEPEPALEWLVEGLWVAKSRGFIAGNPGVGKTWLALDIMLACCTGHPCLGKFAVPARIPVLLVEEEASRRNLQRRIHSMARARNLTPADLKDFSFLTRNFVKLPSDTNQIIQIIKDKGCQLVVFDSLRRVHSQKENVSDDMQPVLEAFSKMGEETGASIVLIHHLSKSQANDSRTVFERMRGSSDFWAWRDTIIGVEATEDELSATVILQFRDAEPTAPFTLRRESNPETGAITLRAICQEEQDDFVELAAKIAGWLEVQMGPRSQNEIYRAMKGNRPFFMRVFTHMKQTGKVRKEGTGWVVSLS